MSLPDKHATSESAQVPDILLESIETRGDRRAEVRSNKAKVVVVTAVQAGAVIRASALKNVKKRPPVVSADVMVPTKLAAGGALEGMGAAVTALGATQPSIAALSYGLAALGAGTALVISGFRGHRRLNEALVERMRSSPDVAVAVGQLQDAYWDWASLMDTLPGMRDPMESTFEVAWQAVYEATLGAAVNNPHAFESVNLGREIGGANDGLTG